MQYIQKSLQNSNQSVKKIMRIILSNLHFQDILYNSLTELRKFQVKYFPP